MHPTAHDARRRTYSLPQRYIAFQPTPASAASAPVRASVELEQLFKGCSPKIFPCRALSAGAHSFQMSSSTHDSDKGAGACTQPGYSAVQLRLRGLIGPIWAQLVPFGVAVARSNALRRDHHGYAENHQLLRHIITIASGTACCDPHGKTCRAMHQRPATLSLCVLILYFPAVYCTVLYKKAPEFIEKR